MQMQLYCCSFSKNNNTKTTNQNNGREFLCECSARSAVDLLQVVQLQKQFVKALSLYSCKNDLSERQSFKFAGLQRQ